MTVDTILNTDLKEFVGRHNVIMQVDGNWYQLPFNMLLDDDLLRREMDRCYFETCLFRAEDDIIDDLHYVFEQFHTYFGYLLKKYKIEQSKLYTK